MMCRERILDTAVADESHGQAGLAHATRYMAALRLAMPPDLLWPGVFVCPGGGVAGAWE
jgi:hypothetical protein